MAGQPAGDGRPTAAGESLQQLLETSAALRRVAASVARGASPGETFSAVAREVAQLLGVDVAAVLRFEPDGTVAVAGRLAGHLSRRPGGRAARSSFTDLPGAPPGAR